MFRNASSSGSNVSHRQLPDPTRHCTRCLNSASLRSSCVVGNVAGGPARLVRHHNFRLQKKDVAVFIRARSYTWEDRPLEQHPWGGRVRGLEEATSRLLESVSIALCGLHSGSSIVQQVNYRLRGEPSYSQASPVLKVIAREASQQHDLVAAPAFVYPCHLFCSISMSLQMPSCEDALTSWKNRVDG